MKKVSLILATIMLIMALASAVNAAELRAIMPTPSLSFSGTTAQCRVSFTDFGSSIVLTLSLWNGNKLVDSWTKTGTSYVAINENCQVISGTTYTLKVTGTCGNATIPTTSVTKTCP